jgi:two-component system, OmpR family, sensor histidine kinase KdpD
LSGWTVPAFPIRFVRVPPAVRSTARSAVAVIAIGMVTFVLVEGIGANQTTAALGYLMVILTLASTWGILEATVASFAGVACLNFFFLPPVGTFTIADPENWLALLVFMATAIVTSQLSGRAQRRTVETLARQRDLERLYALGRALLLWDGTSSPAQAVATDIAASFGFSSVTLYDRHADAIARAGETDLPGVESALHEVALQGTVLQPRPDVVVTAIRLGGAPIGGLAMAGEPLTDTVVQSVANLAAIALERARGQDAISRAEAARQSGELRATLLDAVAHEFKTPLTSVKVAATALAEKLPAGAPENELAVIIGEESDRLEGLVDDATQVLRLESGDFQLHKMPMRARDLLAQTIAELTARLDGRTFINAAPPDVRIDVDSSLARVALRHLTDNAIKYSPPGSTITLGAEPGRAPDTIDLTVHNTGSEVAATDASRVFDRFYRGAQSKSIAGSGMGLAIVRQIARAHGGDVSLETLSDGTSFRISVPKGNAAP